MLWLEMRKWYHRIIATGYDARHPRRLPRRGETGCNIRYDDCLQSSYHDIVKLFGRLPETYRAALEMRLLLDYSGKEIANHLGISETAVNTRISRGRVLLRELAEREGAHV